MEKVKRTPAKLHKLVEAFGFEILHKGRDYDTREITISDLNRPALQLVGFYDYFEPRRLQVFGKAEMMYLRAMTVEQRREVVGLEPQRAPVIVAGLLILKQILEVSGAGSFTVSEYDILHGVVLASARA